MSKKNMQLFAFVMTVLPVMTQGMVVTRIKPALRTIKKQTVRSYNTGAASELRKLINTPKFDLKETRNIIKTLPKDPKSCDVNGLIEDIVFKATEYKQNDAENEVQYTNVLHQLRLHGWAVSGTCCIHTMLHEAAKSDLCRIATELLQQKKELVNDTDMDKRIPLHHAQSKKMATLLIKNGSPINPQDKQGNTPLHCVPFHLVPFLIAQGADIHAENDIYLRTLQNGWQQLTPLRKAVHEGDIEKCLILLGTKAFTEKEIAMVRAIAELNYWRTKDPKFVVIQQMTAIDHLLRKIEAAVEAKKE